MESLVPFFVATIAFCATFTALGFLFNVLLSPLKKDIAKLEQGQAKILEILSGKAELFSKK